jgi:serine/threonine protein kinase
MQKEYYQIEKELGQGGFATSWLARDTRSKQLCVLKKSIWRKWTPGKVWSCLNANVKHSNTSNIRGIPRFIAAWSHEGNEEQAPEAVLVQEYIPGKNLQQWLEDGRRFTETEALELALQMCEILSYLHGFSPPVIHRDIKPGNVILDDKQRLFLIDFGAVKQTLTNQSQSVTMIGTFGYMPLEQMEGKSLPASDLYSLGATLGLSFKRGAPRQSWSEKTSNWISSHTQLSNKFNQILDTLLEPDLNKRYANVAELQADLLKLKQKKHTAQHSKTDSASFGKRQAPPSAC